MVFFEYIKECCLLLDEPVEEFGINMLPKTDISWYCAFEDGLTPTQAVSEYKNQKGII